MLAQEAAQVDQPTRMSLERQTQSMEDGTEPASLDELVQGLRNGKVIQSTPGGMHVRDPVATPDPGDVTEAEPAVGADGHEWMYVEHVEDSVEVDLWIEFSDDFTYEHKVDFDDAAAFLKTLPGVRSAEQQDPGQILLVGTRDAQRIQDSLLEWWAGRAG
jgi:hypothetical protein